MSGEKRKWDVGDLKSLTPEARTATLFRFEWLLEFLMFAPRVATVEEARQLLDGARALSGE